MAKATGALLLSGCAPRYTPEPVRDFNDITKWYPEVLGFEVVDRGIYYTNLSTTNWYNLDPHTKFDSNEAAIIAQFYESFANTHPTLQYTYQQGKTLDFNIRPRITKKNILIIVPSSAPIPSWGTNPNATTEPIDSLGLSVTYVRIVQPDTTYTNVTDSPIFLNTAEATTEQCQRTFEVNVVDTQPLNATSQSQLDALGQEVVCNTIGNTLAKIINGTPVQMVRQQVPLGSITQLNGNSMPLINLGDLYWNNIPINLKSPIIAR